MITDNGSKYPNHVDAKRVAREVTLAIAYYGKNHGMSAATIRQNTELRAAAIAEWNAKEERQAKKRPV